MSSKSTKPFGNCQKKGCGCATTLDKNKTAFTHVSPFYFFIPIMGFTLPSPESPAEQARALMAQKANIEAELETHISILKANNVTMQTPLVDIEGFPRADIDIYAVRGARVRIIELRNDLKAVMDAIGKALEGIYDPSLASQPSTHHDSSSERPLKPFAKVDGVAPGSPAAEAVRIYLNVYIQSRNETGYFQALQRDDLVVKFGQLDESSFKSNSLKPLADLVTENENVSGPLSFSKKDIQLKLIMANESSKLSPYESFVRIKQSS